MEACAECIQMRTQLAGEFRELRTVFEALGCETRQQLFLTLLESDQVGLRVGELAARTHLSRPAVSHHLRILKESGVVSVHRDGTRNYYFANADMARWSAFRALADHVCAVVRYAAAQGYPNLEEKC